MRAIDRYDLADRVLDTVNEAVPDFDLCIVSPANVVLNKAANCFARAILVAAGLKCEDVNLCDMSVLIGTAHGMARQRRAGWGDAEIPYWYGYNVLTLYDENPAIAFDTTDRTFYYNACMAGWQQDYRNYPPLIAVDREKLAIPHSEYAETGIPPTVWNLQSYMTLHGVADSIRHYQITHPILAEDTEPWCFNNYVDAFDSLTNTSHMGASCLTGLSPDTTFSNKL